MYTSLKIVNPPAGSERTGPRRQWTFQDLAIQLINRSGKALKFRPTNTSVRCFLHSGPIFYTLYPHSLDVSLTHCDLAHLPILPKIQHHDRYTAADLL